VADRLRGRAVGHPGCQLGDQLRSQPQVRAHTAAAQQAGWCGRHAVPAWQFPAFDGEYTPSAFVGHPAGRDRNSSLGGHVVVVGLGGTLVWLLGSSAIHIGASGLVFGWFGFLITRGLVDRSPLTLGASVLVGLLYGSFFWGVLPSLAGVSWEAHLFGALAGAAAAFLIRANLHPPRMRDVERR
jgi:hypothetical protein